MARAQPRSHRLYAIAQRADNRFSHRLKVLYGKRAGDMRYRPAQWTDAQLKRLAESFRKATAALQKEWKVRGS